MTTNTPQETPIISGSLVSLDDSFSFCFSSVKGIKKYYLDISEGDWDRTSAIEF